MRETNPSGRHVNFDPEKHRFIIEETGQTLVGATTFISGFFEKFDADKWAPRTAKKRGTTTEAILAEWAEKAKRGRDEGHNVHEYAEYRCLQEAGRFVDKEPAPMSDRCELLFGWTDKAVNWLFKYYELVDVEQIIFSPRLNAAGIIELVMRNEEGVFLFDWKQNREIKNYNPYQNGKGPLSHLQAHDLNKYALQLNVYKYILVVEKYYPDENIGHKLIHLTPDGYYPINLKNMQQEVYAMYKQSLGLFPDFNPPS